MMKVIIAAFAFTFAACASSPQPVVNSNTGSAATNAQRNERSETVIAHSTESRTAPGSDSITAAAPKTKWTQSGDPIDTRELDAAIAAAQKELRSNSSEPSAKKAMADAYLKRAVALTDARQYASALGDYRRVLKYDPENAEAKNWIEQIIGIYSSLGRESPKEGEEPPPLPFEG